MLWILVPIAFIVVLVVLGVALKKLKDFLKVIVLVFIIFSIITLALSILIIMDAKEFQQRINDTSKKYILLEDDRLIAAMGIGNAEPTYYGSEDIERFQAYYTEGTYEKIRQNDYKIFFFDMLSFQETMKSPLDLPGLNIALDEAELVTFMNSENGVEVISNKLYAGISAEAREQITYEDFHNELLGRIGSVEVFKAKVLDLLLDKAMSDDYLGFLKDGIRKGNIRIYPQTIMFSTIKLAPDAIIENIVA
ncbi:MAG: hypothetical protein ABIJ21_09050 [Nanoarchaeota archaeon]